MRKLVNRWYVWLGLVLLLGLAGSVVLIYANPSRITQANFDRIQEEMNEKEVERILGQSARQEGLSSGNTTIKVVVWGDGPSEIYVSFLNGKAKTKNICLVTTWEAIQWYAKKGAEKIGVKWDSAAGAGY